MSIMEIQKKFYEEKTGGMFDTLAAAKKACKWPYVCRVWLQEGKIVGERVLHAYGESLCTIRFADEEIARKLNLKH